jgi:hypothetical protein
MSPGVVVIVAIGCFVLGVVCALGFTFWALGSELSRWLE